MPELANTSEPPAQAVSRQILHCQTPTSLPSRLHTWDWCGGSPADPRRRSQLLSGSVDPALPSGTLHTLSVLALCWHSAVFCTLAFSESTDWILRTRSAMDAPRQTADPSDSEVLHAVLLDQSDHPHELLEFPDHTAL